MFEDVFEVCRETAVEGGAEGLERTLWLWVWLCIDVEED